MHCPGLACPGPCVCSLQKPPQLPAWCLPLPTPRLGENHVSQTLGPHHSQLCLSFRFPSTLSQTPSSAPKTLLPGPGSWQSPPPALLTTPQEFASSKTPASVLASTQHESENLQVGSRSLSCLLSTVPKRGTHTLGKLGRHQTCSCSSSDQELTPIRKRIREKTRLVG